MTSARSTWPRPGAASWRPGRAAAAARGSRSRIRPANPGVEHPSETANPGFARQVAGLRRIVVPDEPHLVAAIPMEGSSIAILTLVSRHRPDGLDRLRGSGAHRQLAWMNGLDPNAPLLAGTALKLPTQAPVAAPAQPQPAPVTLPDAEPNATSARLTSAQIGQVAAQHGVSPSLAAAVAWQESGFSNAVVSSANARGVMQVLPGTWTWVEQNLSQQPLDPNSAIDNVSAGSMYLAQL